MFEKYKKVYKADYEKWYKENEAYRERVAADPDRLKFHLMPKTGMIQMVYASLTGHTIFTTSTLHLNQLVS